MFFRKLVGNNVAALIGIAQVAVPLTREVVVAVIRLVDVFLSGEGLEPLIVKVVEKFNKIEGVVNWFKNVILGRSA